MLKKINRAGKKTLGSVFKNGKTVRSPQLTLRYIITKETGAPRISFVVPKSVTGSAVMRNTLRRRGYSAIEPHLGHLPQGLVGAIIFNSKTEDEKTSPQIHKRVSEILKIFLH